MGSGKEEKEECGGGAEKAVDIDKKVFGTQPRLTLHDNYYY
jgi:hypothetical protein